jgi:hypothetical protein
MGLWLRSPIGANRPLLRCRRKETHRTAQHNAFDALFLGQVRKTVAPQQGVIQIFQIGRQGQAEGGKVENGFNATQTVIDKGFLAQIASTLFDTVRQRGRKACVHHTQLKSSTEVVNGDTRQRTIPACDQELHEFSRIL